MMLAIQAVITCLWLLGVLRTPDPILDIGMLVCITGIVILVELRGCRKEAK